jgi:hypothetical protein
MSDSRVFLFVEFPGVAKQAADRRSPSLPGLPLGHRARRQKVRARDLRPKREAVTSSGVLLEALSSPNERWKWVRLRGQ